jgi:hypothetical protein
MRSRFFFGSVLAHWMLLAISMAMAVGFLSGCDGGTHLKGVVLDPSEMPGAGITLATGTPGHCQRDFSRPELVFAASFAFGCASRVMP